MDININVRGIPNSIEHRLTGIPNMLLRRLCRHSDEIQDLKNQIKELKELMAAVDDFRAALARVETAITTTVQNAKAEAEAAKSEATAARAETDALREEYKDYISPADLQAITDEFNALADSLSTNAGEGQPEGVVVNAGGGDTTGGTEAP